MVINPPDPLWVECSTRVCRVLSENTIDVSYATKQLLTNFLYKHQTYVEPAIAGRHERERHEKLSALPDKTDALLRDLKEFDAFERSENAIRGKDANGMPIYPIPLEWENTVHITIPKLASLREVLGDLTADPPDSPKRGKPASLRGVVSDSMYRAFCQAGETDAWKCSQIIVDILDGDVADKPKRVQAMYDRLHRISPLR